MHLVGREEVSEDVMEEIVQDKVEDISEAGAEYDEWTWLTRPEDNCYPPWQGYPPPHKKTQV